MFVFGWELCRVPVDYEKSAILIGITALGNDNEVLDLRHSDAVLFRR